MALVQPPVTGYFTARRVGSGNVPTLILSATDGGSPAWAHPLTGSTFEEIRDALAAFLDENLQRNINPVIDSRVYDAPAQLGLDFSIAEAIYAGAQLANEPLVDWTHVVQRIDRIAFELDRLRYLIELYRAQNGLS